MNTHATVVSRPSMYNIGQRADALWTNHLALRRRQTKTEIAEDGDGRRQRQMKTETVEDEDRLTLGTSEVSVPSQLTTPRSEHRT